MATTKKAVPLTKSTVRMKVASAVSLARMDSVNAPKANGAAGKTNAKTMSKHIPPHDYKARFAKLQAEHKALVKKYERILEYYANSKALLEQYQDVATVLETSERRQYEAVARYLERTIEKNRELKQTSVKLSAALQKSEAELAQYRDKLNATNTENLELKEQLREIEALNHQHQAVMSDLESTIEENRQLKQTIFHF